jgi:hypothetical protein
LSLQFSLARRSGRSMHFNPQICLEKETVKLNVKGASCGLELVA